MANVFPEPAYSEKKNYTLVDALEESWSYITGAFYNEALI